MGDYMLSVRLREFSTRITEPREYPVLCLGLMGSRSICSGLIGGLKVSDMRKLNQTLVGFDGWVSAQRQ